MKFTIALMALVASVSAETCPEHVTVTAYDDKKCEEENAEKSEEINQDWTFLATVFNKGCYYNGVNPDEKKEWLKWSCTEEHIKAAVYEDEECNTQAAIDEDHPIEKKFGWDQCTSYGASNKVWVKVSKE